LKGIWVVSVIVSILILGGIFSSVDVLGAAVKTVEELCSKGGGFRLVLCAAIDTLTADNTQLTADNTQLTADNTQLTTDNAALTLQVANLESQLPLDIVTANANSNDVSVLLGTGTGTFGGAANFGVGTFQSSVAVGDFNNDGDLDIVTASSGSLSASWNWCRYVWWSS